MNPRLALGMLGVLVALWGIVYLHIDEPPSPFALWENVRGWVWLSVGTAAAGMAAFHGPVRVTQWVIAAVGGLVGERLLIGIALLVAHPTWRLAPLVLGQTGVMMLVLIVAAKYKKL